MFNKLFSLRTLALVCLLVGLSACSFSFASPSTVPSQTEAAAGSPAPSTLLATPTPPLSPTPLPPPTATPPPRRLTLCLGREPAGLFPYTAASSAARAVLSAIYAGPFAPGVHLNNLEGSILEQPPSFNMLLEPVSVEPGAAIVDSRGELATLAEGVRYRPSGCASPDCELAYAGNASIQMDQWVLRYTLHSGLTWSDGAALTASDSRYGYEVAVGLFPRVQADLLARTASYTALDERTLEWRGLPGYQDGDASGKFFPPLPRHAWQSIPIAELPESEAADRRPLGWGPYVLSDWQPGESLLLQRNPAYFRSAEGLPHFDELLFRFLPDPAQASAALQAGECDLLDPLPQEPSPDLQVFRQPASWTHLLFGLRPADERRPAPFADPAVRQAAALCIDRAAVAQAAGGTLLQAYVASESPFFNPQAALPGFDPPAAAPLLTNAGWVDADADSTTPRTAQGAPGFEYGAPFTVSLLVPQDAALQAAAGVVQQGLAACGIALKVEARPAAEVLAPGPAGPVFGRAFDLALFAWPASDLPPCRLFLSREIPGAYPTYPRGWGGANAAGYSSPAYDLACTRALTALPGSPEITAGYSQAQALLAQDLPLLPLYAKERLSAARPGLCHLAGADSRLDWGALALWGKDQDCSAP